MPLASPFAEDAISVTDVPLGIVDWIPVQLRNAPNGPNVTSKSAFLRKDGRIVGDDGASPRITLNTPAGEYYLVVKHRNHCAGMSAGKVTLSASGSALYDFTVNKMLYGTNPAKQLKNGLWCLFAGDANQDGGVYAEDYIRYKLTQGKKGYMDADFNLDGGVYAEDYILYRINQGKRSGVPSNK